jgi:UDP-N-acetylglucosamine--N-acetylmuramyl-(pentapeptide) pyrophosphoryl-undecaprenol N-acetylglucosamine transferase
VNRPYLMFAGGGTGGHVYPLIAVADAVRSLDPSVGVVFVGTQRGLETRIVPERGYELELVRVRPMRGDGALGALSGALRAAGATVEAGGLFAKYRPSAVFSIGGYAAGPVALAARLRGVKVALIEPNSEIGLANRLIAPFVQRAYTAFPESARFFRSSLVLQAGVPIRAGFEAAPYAPSSGNLRVLVFGGSQGARSLNEAVPRALAALKLPLRVLHQCGSAEERAVRALYRELGLEALADVRPFIDDMQAALAGADLVVARSGASSVAEICAVGRPSLLVPYPHAGDHQRMNAASLETAGAALAVADQEATAERLARELEKLCADPGRLARMAEAARRIGRPEAAYTIARDLLKLADLASADRPVPVHGATAERGGSG